MLATRFNVVIIYGEKITRSSVITEGDQNLKMLNKELFLAIVMGHFEKPR